MNLFLYGPMGTGKTTVGAILAERLDWPFIDTDKAIEESAGMPVAEIFHVEGEAAFRAREKRLIAEIVRSTRQVVSLGGGSLVDPENRAAVEASGPVVMLTCDPEVILHRLGDELVARPLLEGPGPLERLKSILAKRAALYDSFPLRIETTKLTPEDAAKRAQLLVGFFRVRGMGGGYDVLVHSGLFSRLGGAFEARKLGGPIVVVTDSNVGPIYLKRVVDALGGGQTVGSITLDAGEGTKNLATMEKLYGELFRLGMERRGTVVALGGGVITDLAGYAAATFLRGVNWVALPTSLLGMVDAAIGGKTAVDLPQGKNLVGAFHPPAAVLADLDALATLPQRELRAGMAEVIKSAIVGDSTLLGIVEALRGTLDPAKLDEIVRRTVRVKIRVVEEDPFEHRGPREALNFGHTIGHAIESCSGYDLAHGEAVGLGMIAESALSENLQVSEPGLSARLAAILGGLGLPTRYSASADEIIHQLQGDKKRRGGRVRWALPVAPGKVRIGLEVEDAEMRAALQILQ